MGHVAHFPSPMKILVLNAGSSSLKYALYEMSHDSDQLLGEGLIERVTSMSDSIRDAFAALGGTVAGVGHRVVHGGTFPASLVIDAAVEGYPSTNAVPLAPLHNPHSLAAYRAAANIFERHPRCRLRHRLSPDDPPEAHSYAMPPEYLTEKKIRRYGFHGISHRSVALRFAEDSHSRISGGLSSSSVISGTAAPSVRWIAAAPSTPRWVSHLSKELVMGTRSGDVDASALLHLSWGNISGACLLVVSPSGTYPFRPTGGAVEIEEVGHGPLLRRGHKRCRARRRDQRRRDGGDAIEAISLPEHRRQHKDRCH